jgi:molybdenum cofactor cytidylyltransferase
VIAGILLAAGAATRFGGGKLRYPLHDRVPVGVAALRNLQSAVDQVVAVVRPGDDELRRLFETEGVPLIECALADRGMGHSLAAGVAGSMDADGWLIALGDMPLVQPRTIRTLAHALEQGSAIVVPVFGGQRGHPVGFSRRFRAELLDLLGDAGARTVVSAHAAAVHRLDVDDPGVLQDVDTHADAQRLAGT